MARAVSGVCDEARIPLVWVHSNRGIVGYADRRVSDHVRAGTLAAEHLVGDARVDRPRLSWAGSPMSMFSTATVTPCEEGYEGYESIAGGVGLGTSRPI